MSEWKDLLGKISAQGEQGTSPSSEEEKGLLADVARRHQEQGLIGRLTGGKEQAVYSLSFVAIVAVSVILITLVAFAPETRLPILELIQSLASGVLVYFMKTGRQRRQK